MLFRSLDSNQDIVKAALEAAAMAPAPIAATAAPTPQATAVADRQPDNVHIEPQTQAAAQPVLEEENLGDAARRARQRKACLELAKDNSTITCN